MAKYLETKEFLDDFENGIMEAFVELFNEYFSRLFVFSYKLTEHDEKAKDITVHAFNEIFENPKRFNSLYSLRTNLYRIVYDASLHYANHLLLLSEAQQVYMAIVERDMDLKYVQMEGEIMEALYVEYKKGLFKI